MRTEHPNVIAFPPRPDLTGRALPPWRRDPRRFPYGLLLVDPWPVATVASGFCWFTSESEAAEFLRDGLWEVLDEQRMSPFPGVREIYRAAFARRADITQSRIDAVSSLQDHVLVLWFGRFDALLRGDPGFALALLEEYQSESGCALSGGLDVDGYVAFLARYLR